MVTRAIEPPGPPAISAAVPGARSAADADHGDDREQHGEHAPEGELAPHPAAIDDGIGIERHGLISLD